MAPPAGALSRRPSWRPSGWNPNKAPAATKTSSLPACTKLLPLQARSTRRRSTGQGEACHALHVASHLAPRPLPSHPARRPSFPPRHLRHVRVAKASGMLLDGRASFHPPHASTVAPHHPPTHTHTHRERAYAALRSSSQEAPMRPTWRPACTQLPNLATFAHATGSSEALVAQFPHLSGLIRQPLIDGSSRELRGLSPRR